MVRVVLVVTWLLPSWVCAQDRWNPSETQVEDRAYIEERMKAHTRSSKSPAALQVRGRLKAAAHEVKQFHGSDRHVIEEVLALDRREIERRAVQPIMAEMCAKLGKRNTDVVALARMLSLAEQAQESALEDAINSRLKGMSQAGYRLVNAMMTDTNTIRSERRRVDWEGVAVDVPLFTRFALEAACENFAAIVSEEADEGEDSRSSRRDTRDDRSIDMQ